MFKNYFATPILTKENFLPEPTAVQLKKFFLQLREGTHQNARSWHSAMNLLHVESECIQVFEKAVTESFKEFQYKWTMQNYKDQENLIAQDREEDVDQHDEQPTYSIFSWAFTSKADCFCEPHVHPFAIYTAVYYLHMPKDLKAPEGCIEFLNPIPGATQSRPISDFERLLIQPKENSLLVFPAYMHHWAHPFKDQTQERTIIGTDYCTNLPSYAKAVTPSKF